MVWPTGSDLFIRAALGASAGATAAVVLCCTAILSLRFGNLARARRLARLQSEWREVLAAGMAGERLTLDVAPRDRWDFLKLWCALHDSVRGEARDALKITGRHLGLPVWAEALAGRRQLRDRLVGLTALGRLGAVQSTAWVEPHMDDADPVISIIAAQAYVRLVPARALPRLLESAARRSDWPAARIVEILRDAGSVNVAGPLLGALRNARGEERRRLIPFLTVLDAAQSADILRQLCADPDDPECVAGALKLMRSPDSLELVRQAAGHPQWFVRVQACRAFGRFGTRDDLKVLTRLLGDRHWWVRYRAAEALTRMPFVPKEDLRKLARRHPDKYARDMLGMWLDSTGTGR